MPPPALQPRSRPDLGRIEELAAQALSTSRPLSSQVLQYLLAHHEVEGSEVVPWLREKLPSLEGYEQDLLLSPLFTPEEEVRLEFERLLGESWLDPAEVEAFIQRLAGRGLRLTLLHEGERLDAPLPDVAVERFVRLLHLDSELPIDALAPFDPVDAEVRVQLRDAAWRRPASRALLPSLLRAALSVSEGFASTVRFLTDFVRTYRPASREDCIAFLDHLAEAYEVDLQNYQSGLRSFFDEELKGSYGGKWKVPEEIVAEHRARAALARAIRGALAAG